MANVVVINSGLSNIDSICRALELCGANVQVISSVRGLGKSDRLVLPGVGAFPPAMKRLEKLGFAEYILKHISEERPFLGICLGMQLMAEFSLELKKCTGLGILPAYVRPLTKTSSEERIPHMGWSPVDHDQTHPLFSGIPTGTDFYFVHGYHMVCLNDPHILARTNAYGSFAAAVGRGVIFGVQFHPEKSQRPGLALLRNFLSM